MTGMPYIAAQFAARFCLVLMFPFSAYDKIAHWDEAMAQAHTTPLPGAPAMLVSAIITEALAPVCILFGWHAASAALILAAFCVVTALLYHPFWRFPDFWTHAGAGRAHFWDFLKNFGLTGGLLLVAISTYFAPDGHSLNHTLNDALSLAQH